MVDYNYSSNEGTLRIRDLGATIEFWVQAGYTNFYWDNLSFNVSANGTTYPFSVDYPSGAPWVKVGQVSVTTTQTITYRLLTSTGTSSLGGPTTVSRLIDRGGPPDAPSKPTFSGLWSTYVTVSFNDGDNNGLAIDSRRIGYGTSSAAPQQFISSDRSTQILNLKSGAMYYFWAQTHNSKGYSPYSVRANIETLSVPAPPTTPTISAITQNSFAFSFATSADTGGTAITATELGYNTQNGIALPGAVIISSAKTGTIKNLSAGVKYYVWARSKNAIGYSAWSNVAVVQLNAGGWVKQGTVFKRAVPYVKSGGVWKVAEVWGKNGGFWKKPAS